MGQCNYKVFGTVTNLNWDGGEVIRWQRGKSEEAHSVMKGDLAVAGGKFPSGKFGANAAWSHGLWWWCMILAMNQAMKKLVLGKSWMPK